MDNLIDPDYPSNPCEWTPEHIKQLAADRYLGSPNPNKLLDLLKEHVLPLLSLEDPNVHTYMRRVLYRLPIFYKIPEHMISPVREDLVAMLNRYSHKKPTIGPLVPDYTIGIMAYRRIYYCVTNQEDFDREVAVLIGHDNLSRLREADKLPRHFYPEPVLDLKRKSPLVPSWRQRAFSFNA
jgi:hypothetical protein